MGCCRLLFLGLFFFYPLLAIFRLDLRRGKDLPGAQVDLVRHLAPRCSSPWQAALSTLLTLLVGLPAAYLFARFSFPGKALLAGATTLPFILPTVVVAAGFNALLGPRGWLNLGLMACFRPGQPADPAAQYAGGDLAGARLLQYHRS